MSKTMSVCQKCGGVNKVERERALQGGAVCGKCQALLPMHGLVTEVNTAGFEKVLRNVDQPVIVDFWASWCGPCRVYGPEFQKASEQNQSAVFLKINTETEPELSAKLGVRGIPCTIIFKDGKEVRRQAGAMQVSDIERLLQSL